MKEEVSRGDTITDYLSKIIILAVADGYVMCRRPGAIPFIKSVKEWNRLYKDDKLKESRVMVDIDGAKPVMQKCGRCSREKKFTCPECLTETCGNCSHYGKHSNTECFEILGRRGWRTLGEYDG